MLEENIKQSLKIIWNYMVLDMPIQKSDLIIGCGCTNLKIPEKCAELLKQDYAQQVLFTGGLGKLSSSSFKNTEAEIYKDIAIKNGINIDKIYVENKSTNTGDNFRFSLEMINKNNIKANKILIVHNKLSQRRTLSTAKAIMKNKELYITSPDVTYNKFIINLEKRTYEDINSIISVVVGDIQRMIIFPQLGWQIEEDVPKEVIDAYYVLKNKGYNKFIFSKNEIQKLIDKNGLAEGKQANYFN